MHEKRLAARRAAWLAADVIYQQKRSSWLATMFYACAFMLERPRDER
jgi:hypothetical protein